MATRVSRRQVLAGMMASLPAAAKARPAGTLIDTHVHLFDPKQFPYAPKATYTPPPQPLEPYAKFALDAGIAHTVIVHPEPYQDDHRYLEYCFAHEPRPGFFKGTCLFDPIAPATPSRMEALVKKHPGRIVALRIHEMHTPGTPSLASGPIKDRDMSHPAMAATWAKAQALGLAIQMHFLPYYATQIRDLATRTPGVYIVLDHLARAGQGTAEDYNNVLKLAKNPRVFMKYSGVAYSSKTPFPHSDAKPIVRRAYDAFGPDRIVWGGLGMNAKQFEQQTQLFDEMFDFASESDRAKIRGLNAAKLFRFS